VDKVGRRDATIVVTGATGQIGYEAIRALAPLGEVVPLTRDDLDLANRAAILKTIKRLRPQVIVNAAAYTSVDAVESPTAVAARRVCDAINGDAPGTLAEAAKELGALLVHYSTDYVFDGRKRTPYVEADRPGPLNYYGKSKLAGEQAVQTVGGAYVILRTSWVYGPRGKNFLLTIRRLALERSELRVVIDQESAPTSSRAVAEATRAVVQKVLADPEPLDLSGVYHLAAAGQTNWFEFARAILAADEGLQARVKQTSSKDYGAPAERPAYSVLDCSAIHRRFGIALPHWRDQLARVLAELDETASR
jgi:dTDP-4-dehydrorhamnose reductase